MTFLSAIEQYFNKLIDSHQIISAAITNMTGLVIIECFGTAEAIASCRKQQLPLKQQQQINNITSHHSSLSPVTPMVYSNNNSNIGTFSSSSSCNSSCTSTPISANYTASRENNQSQVNNNNNIGYGLFPSNYSIPSDCSNNFNDCAGIGLSNRQNSDSLMGSSAYYNNSIKDNSNNIRNFKDNQTLNSLNILAKSKNQMIEIDSKNLNDNDDSNNSNIMNNTNSINIEDDEEEVHKASNAVISAAQSVNLLQQMHIGIPSFIAAQYHDKVCVQFIEGPCIVTLVGSREQHDHCIGSLSALIPGIRAYVVFKDAIALITSQLHLEMHQEQMH